jgi:hypothetical protein
MSTPEASIINFLFPNSSLQLLQLGPESLVAQLTTILAINQRLASLSGSDREDSRLSPDAGEILFSAAILDYASSHPNNEEVIFVLRDWWTRLCAQEKLRMEEEDERSCSCGEDSTEEEPTEARPTEEQLSEHTQLKGCNFEILDNLFNEATQFTPLLSRNLTDSLASISLVKSSLDPHKMIYDLTITDKAAENRFTQLTVDWSNAKERMVDMYDKIKAILTVKLHARSDFSPASVHVQPRKICLECFEALEQTNGYQSKLFKGFKEEDMNLVVAGKMILKWLEIVAETLPAEVKDKVIEDITSILKTAFKCTL